MSQIFKTIMEMFKISDVDRKDSVSLKELALREKIKGLFQEIDKAED